MCKGKLFQFINCLSLWEKDIVKMSIGSGIGWVRKSISLTQTLLQEHTCTGRWCRYLTPATVTTPMSQTRPAWRHLALTSSSLNQALDRAQYQCLQSPVCVCFRMVWQYVIVWVYNQIPGRWSAKSLHDGDTGCLLVCIALSSAIHYIQLFNLSLSKVIIPRLSSEQKII